MRLLFLLPATTVYQFVAAGLLSLDVVEEALADSRDSGPILIRTPRIDDEPDPEIDRLIRDYVGRPAAGTSMRRVHGRHRHVTRLPAAA